MVRAVLKSYRKNILREMKDNLSRMVSLFGIVALGVMMLTGLMSFAPSMRIAGQKYYVQQNVFDLRVLSTLGRTWRPSGRARARRRWCACSSCPPTPGPTRQKI